MGFAHLVVLSARTSGLNRMARLHFHALRAGKPTLRLVISEGPTAKRPVDDDRPVAEVCEIVTQKTSSELRITA